MRAARETVRLDPAIKRNIGLVAKKAFAASLALAGALLSQSAGAEERLTEGFDAVRACSGDIEKLCSGVEPSGGRIKACIQGKVSELSTPCKEVLVVFIASGESVDVKLGPVEGKIIHFDADLRVTPPPRGRLAIAMPDEFRNTYDPCGCDDACIFGLTTAETSQ